jgi:hypothetical protein
MLFGVAAILVGSYTTVVALFSFDSVGPTFVSAIVALCGVVVASAFAGLIGLAWAAFVAWITLPCVCAFTRTLHLNVGMTWIGAISGGLVGFLAVLPLVMNVSISSRWEAAMIMAIGPGLTTILGQIGGAWGGSNCYSSWVEWAQTPAAGQPAQFTAASGRGVKQRSQARFQFSIRQLLWLALWLSLLLSLIRLSGAATDVALPLLFGWMAYQAVTLAAGTLFVRTLRRWRIARGEWRST